MSYETVPFMVCMGDVQHGLGDAGAAGGNGAGEHGIAIHEFLGEPGMIDTIPQQLSNSGMAFISWWSRLPGSVQGDWILFCLSHCEPFFGVNS